MRRRTPQAILSAAAGLVLLWYAGEALRNPNWHPVRMRRSPTTAFTAYIRRSWRLLG